mgnify:CR=1 FL=1
MSNKKCCIAGEEGRGGEEELTPVVCNDKPTIFHQTPVLSPKMFFFSTSLSRVLLA